MKRFFHLVIVGVLFLFSAPSIAHAEQVVSTQDTPGGQLVPVEEMADTVVEFPLKHTSVHADITGYVAEVEVEQHYVNPYEEPIEAVYIFPLPQDSAVYDMEMVIGDRVVGSEIYKREQAKQIYEQAKNQGQRAGLLEQERPNIFTQSVANILPGDEITITIRYSQTLAFEDTDYEFVFPMVVGPRYIPGEWIEENFISSVTDFERLNPPVVKAGTRSAHDIDVTVNLNTGSIPLKSITSNTHDIDVSRNGEFEGVVTLQPQDTIPNKDFVLKYSLTQDAPDIALFTHNPSDGEDGYFTLMVQPHTNYDVSEVTPKEVFFMVDASGSMRGTPIEKAKESMLQAITNLNPEDTFYIMKFASSTEKLSVKPLTNTPENILNGIQFINDIDAGGGTQMLPGIIDSLDYPHDEGKLRLIVVMSDGQIGNETQILEKIENSLGDQSRLFSFGIGASPNRYLMDNMARIGRGSSYYVSNDEESEVVVDDFYERIESPLLTDLHIDWGDMTVSEIYPNLVPDLFAGQPLYVHGRYSGPPSSTISVSGRVADVDIGAFSVVRRAFGGEADVSRADTLLTLDANFPTEQDENEWVGRSWARSKITSLTDAMFTGTSQTLIDQITQLGLQHRLVTDYTSFVAVEEGIVNESGEVTRVAIPVELPDGTTYEGYFGTPSAQKTTSPSSGSSGGIGLQYDSVSQALGSTSGIGTSYSSVSTSFGSSDTTNDVLSFIEEVVDGSIAALILFYGIAILLLSLIVAGIHVAIQNKRQKEHKRYFILFLLWSLALFFLLPVTLFAIFLAFNLENADSTIQYIARSIPLVLALLLILYSLFRNSKTRVLILLSLWVLFVYKLVDVVQMFFGPLFSSSVFWNAGLLYQLIIFLPVLLCIAYGVALYAYTRNRPWAWKLVLALGILGLFGIFSRGVWPLYTIGVPSFVLPLLLGIYRERKGDMGE